MKLTEIFEKIETYASRGPWADKAIEIYNSKGLNSLFKYIQKTKSKSSIKVIKQDFFSDTEKFKDQDEAVLEFIEILDSLPITLNAEAGGGGAGGGGAGGGGAAGGTGGTGGATGGTSSGGDGGSADSGSTGDSGTTSSDSTPSSDAPVSRGYIGLGSMAPYKSKNKKKKKKKASFKFGQGIYENIQQMENRLSQLEVALGQAREITRDIKRDDTHINILSKLGVLAEEVGLELDNYQESRVLQVHNQLESEIYELEEVFLDAIRNIKNQIDELEYDEDI